MTTTVNPGFRLMSSEVKDITKDVINDFRAIKPSPSERELNAGRVNHLRRKAEAGQLVTFHWVLAKFNGEIIRMNGQHSSKMLSDLDGILPTGLKVHFEQYEVDNANGLAILFRQFDDRRSGRTSADIAAVYQGLQPGIAKADHKIARLAVNGIAWYRAQIMKTDVPIGDNRYDMFSQIELHPFINWVAEVNTSKTREMQKKEVVAAMFGTFDANEQAARKFWDEVSRGGDPDEEDLPQTVLDTWLRNIHEQGKEEDFEPKNYYQGCVYAWNAFREDKRITAIKSDVKKNVASIRE